jgi:hypothetical protein
MVLENIPAEPKPATTRPTINVGEFGATPQIMEPNSKIATMDRKAHFGE